MRSPIELARDVKTTRILLSALQAELAAAIAARREAVVKAFDDGASRTQLSAAFELPLSHIGSILHNAGRSERQRLALKLEPDQRPHYLKLLRQRVPARIAAQIAGAVA